MCARVCSFVWWSSSFVCVAFTIRSQRSLKDGVGGIVARVRRSFGATRICYRVSFSSAFSPHPPSLFASVASSSLGARLVSGFSPPWVVTQMVLSMLESTIKEVAQFSVYDLQPIAVVPTMRVPALFMHAEDDTLIGVHHVEKLAKARPKR